MDAYQKYVDAMNDLAMIIKDGQGHSQGAKLIQARMLKLYSELEDEEKVWVDEQFDKILKWAEINE